MGSHTEVAPHPQIAPRETALVYAALTAQTLISAGTYLAARRAMTELHPLTLVICRFAVSTFVFIGILLITPGAKLPPRSALWKVLGLGLLAGPTNQGFFFLGLYRSSPAHAALLYALTPLGVYLVMLSRKQERVHTTRIAGIAVAFAGVAVLLLGRGLRAAMGPLVGDLLIVVAVVAWVFYTADGKQLSERHGPIRATAWTMSAGALLSFPFAPFVFKADEVLHASHVAIACIVFLGLVTSVISYLLWYYALSRMQASRVAVFSNLQPVATAIAAWLVLGDPLVWEIFVGGALVIAGVRLTQRR